MCTEPMYKQLVLLSITFPLAEAVSMKQNLSKQPWQQEVLQILVTITPSATQNVVAWIPLAFAAWYQAQKLTVTLQKDYFKAKEDGILSFKQESHNSLYLEPA